MWKVDLLSKFNLKTADSPKIEEILKKIGI